MFPSSLQSHWNESPKHSFIANAAATKEYGEATGELSITKAKLLIDTLAGTELRSIRARVMELMDTQWIPVKDVELKLGVKRLGGELPAGEEESYTTDS